jgi:ribosomal protein L4
LKPKDASNGISEFAEAEINLIQYILFALEENAIQQCSKSEDPNMVSNSHRFGPPTGITHRHRRKEEEAPHLHTGDNKSKAGATTLNKTYPLWSKDHL